MFRRTQDVSDDRMEVATYFWGTIYWGEIMAIVGYIYLSIYLSIYLCMYVEQRDMSSHNTYTYIYSTIDGHNGMYNGILIFIYIYITNYIPA